MNEEVSNRVRDRVRKAGGSFFANDNIAAHLMPGEKVELLEEVEHKVASLLRSLVIDTENDHNTQSTAKRVAKMYLTEVFKGRYDPLPKLTDFPNAKNLNEIYTLGPVAVRSTCSHHFVPIIGQAWIGIIPGERVIGISKFSRVLDWCLSRPHIQEEAAVQIADTLEHLIKPKGLALVIKAEHLCMTWRGIKETNTKMVNSIVRGVFMNNQAAREEFFSIIRGQGY